MTQTKSLLTRTHKGGTGSNPVGLLRIPTAEDEVQQGLQWVRMAPNQSESV